jgi:beta-lactamase regulating signal transducer with metallopeptidase domain
MNSFSIFSDNLISWWIQVTVIAALGAVLPLLFRIRHPRTQLAFHHFILVLCILIPFIEPWQHPLMVITSNTVQQAAYVRTGISWITYLEWVIAAGIVAKMCWLASGLRQIRRFRTSAVRIFPIPESIREARMLTHADARFGISRDVDGPATLGYVDPIVLLPESFLSLDADAQLSIACHELMHVKRSDWLVTLIEEIIGAIFWFNPAMWLLLSQTRLSREQLVDSEVVAMTAAPTPYVQALLVMAGAPGKLKAVPAASFLAGGHLSQRVRSLLTKPGGSVSRLLASYVSIACLLILLASASMVWFPLIGEAHTIETSALKRMLPPVLILRTRPPVTVVTRGSTFNVRVPGPDAPARNTVFYLSAIAAGPGAKDVTMLLPPPPAFIQSFGALAGPGLRVFRPGDKATPEDIARMQAALGERTLIEVIQTEDGTVQKITIQRRRSPDEIDTDPIHPGPWSSGVVATGSTVPAGADRIH